MANFADINSASKIIEELYPDASEVNFVEHGYDNLVGLVDEKYVIKFPRYEGAYLKDQYERLVLLDLEELKGFATPKVLGQGDNPPYVILSFVSGKHLNANEINKLPIEQQKKVGEKVARFAFAMHSMLSPDLAIQNREKLGIDDQKDQPWVIYFEEVLNKVQFPTPEQDKIAKEYYQKWKSLKYSTPTVVVHDDLQTDNLMFEKDELIGVIDFGDTILGYPEQELRQMHRINELVLQTAVGTYEQLSDYKLNVEAIKLWAILQELAAYSDRLFKHELDSAAYQRASKNLQKWLPEGKWRVS